MNHSSTSIVHDVIKLGTELGQWMDYLHFLNQVAPCDSVSHGNLSHHTVDLKKRVSFPDPTPLRESGVFRAIYWAFRMKNVMLLA